MADAVDYDDLRRQLLRAVRRTCPRWLADRAEDVVQSAMLRLLRHPGGENPALGNPSYVWRVAYTATVDEIRRARREPDQISEESDVHDGEGAAPARGAGRGTASPALGEALRACLRRLHEARRHAVLLHFHGFALDESARLLGCDRKRLENLRYRGLSDLRRCLEEHGVTGGRAA